MFLISMRSDSYHLTQGVYIPPASCLTLFVISTSESVTRTRVVLNRLYNSSEYERVWKAAVAYNVYLTRDLHSSYLKYNNRMFAKYVILNPKICDNVLTHNFIPVYNTEVTRKVRMWNNDDCETGIVTVRVGSDETECPYIQSPSVNKYIKNAGVY